MKKVELAFPLDELAAFFPARKRRNEEIGRRELNVEVQALLEVGKHGSQVHFRDELDVEVSRHLPPTVKYRGSATNEIDPGGFGSRSAEFSHELPHSGRVYF